MISFKKQSATSIWITGIPLWPIYLFGLIVIVFLQQEILNFTSQIIVFLYNSFMIAYVLLLFNKTIKENEEKGFLWLKKGFLALAVIGTVYFIFENCFPYTIDTHPTTNDSPFASWYEEVKQTNFGYPFPFFRNLKSSSELYGKYIFDAATLSINLVFYSACGYCLIGLNLFIQTARDGSKSS